MINKLRLEGSLNTEKFNKIIKEFSGESQFIIVIHTKEQWLLRH